MNTVLSRLNTIFAFALTVLAISTFGCFASTFFLTHESQVDLSVGKVLVRRAKDWTIGDDINDLGSVALNMNVDLDHLFNWNVKQLFLYLTAEYETTNNKVNQVVLWDKIILRGENGKLHYRNMNPKYYFWDDGTNLRANNNVTLTLSWNVIPNAGQLLNIRGSGTHSFPMPADYATSRDI